MIIQKLKIWIKVDLVKNKKGQNHSLNKNTITN